MRPQRQFHNLVIQKFKIQLFIFIAAVQFITILNYTQFAFLAMTINKNKRQSTAAHEKKQKALKWYHEVKRTAVQFKNSSATNNNCQKLLHGPTGFTLPKKEATFNKFVSSKLMVPLKEQDNNLVWAFIQKHLMLKTSNNVRPPVVEKSQAPSLSPTISTETIVTPRGANQAHYLNYLKDPNVSLVVCTGSAGCGKTLFACVAAARALESDPLINRIIITRPTVSTSENLGFLPGNVDSKMSPWVQPIVDNLLKIYKDKRTIDAMISSGKIELSPLGFMRGRTFDNAFIIADEMQNSTPEQMKMFLTRIGMGSKVVITGDLNQSDLGRTQQGPRTNGLSDIMERFRVANVADDNDDNESSAKIRFIELGVQDVQRSSVVKKILTIYG